MIEFIKDFLSDGWLGAFMLLLIIILIVIVLGLILWFLHWAVDSWFQPQYDGTGTVIEKSFTPAHTTTTFIMSRNVMIPITDFIPDTWTLYLIAEDRIGSIDVTHEFYNSTKQGQELRIRYRCGRLSKSLYVDDII